MYLASTWPNLYCVINLEYLHPCFLRFSLVMFWLYPQYSLGLNLYIGAKFCKHLWSLSQGYSAGIRDSVPSRSQWVSPGKGLSQRVLARPSIYPFVKAKPVFTVILKWKWLPWILSDEAVNGLSKKNADVEINYVLKKESSCVLTNVFTISCIYNIRKLTIIFGIAKIY